MNGRNMQPSPPSVPFSSIPEILFTGLTHAGKVIQHPQFGSSLRYIISIGDPDETLPLGYQTSSALKLRLEFDDIEHASIPAGYIGCTQDDIVRLVDFCRGIQAEPGPTLIHCAAGISRSSASTLVLLAVLLGPQQEHQAVEHLLAIKARSTEQGFRYHDDAIFPNRRIITFADQLLAREGRLLQACRTRFDYSWHPDYSE